MKQLHKSIHYICGFAVEHLADSSKFPEEWLFKHRWGKGKKDSSTVLPNGSRFVYLKVGGRTSCVVPSVQKKTGPVAKDIEEQDESENSKKNGEDANPMNDDKPSKSKKGQSNKMKGDPTTKPSNNKRRGAQSKGSLAGKTNAEDENASDEESKPAAKKRKSDSAGTDKGNVKSEDEGVNLQSNGTKECKGQKTGRRRSARVTRKSS